MLERPLTYQREAILQGFAGGEFRSVQDHLPALRSSTGRNVVQQLEQMLAESSRCRASSRPDARLASPNMRSRSTSEKPMMAFSGVRSSWDILARNSDLCRLATSSTALCRSSCRCSCALIKASADWLANVSSRSQISCGMCPGCRRRQTSAPMMRPSRSMGTATRERQPPSATTTQVGIEWRVAKVRELQDRPCFAALPRKVSSSRIRCAGERRAARLAPQTVRMRNSRRPRRIRRQSRTSWNSTACNDWC